MRSPARESAGSRSRRVVACQASVAFDFHVELPGLQPPRPTWSPPQWSSPKLTRPRSLLRLTSEPDIVIPEPSPALSSRRCSGAAAWSSWGNESVSAASSGGSSRPDLSSPTVSPAGEVSSGANTRPNGVSAAATDRATDVKAMIQGSRIGNRALMRRLDHFWTDVFHSLLPVSSRLVPGGRCLA